MREEYSYLLSQIGNADQTHVFFYMPRNTSIEKQGVRSVTRKLQGLKNKDVAADGGKLPPCVIFKRKTLLKEKFPSRIHVRVQEKI
jgi:hypothetical protein